MKKIFILVSLAVVVVSGFVLAQKEHNISIENRWKTVEQLAEKQLPESALKEVDEILAQAQKEKNSGQIIKAMLYKMRFTLDKAPDKAPELIHEFEMFAEKSTDPAEKALLHSMTAELYARHYQSDRRTINRRTQITGFVPDDIKEWSKNIYFDKISALLDRSLENIEALQKTDVLQFDVLIEKGEDSPTLQPTLFDFLAHRKIEMLTGITEAIDLKNPLQSDSYFASFNDFIALQLDTLYSVSIENQVLKTYQQLIAFHIKDKNEAALLDVDLSRLEYVKTVSGATEAYLNALAVLENKYAKNEIVVEVLSEKANYYLQKSYESGENGIFRRKAYDVCADGIKRFPKYKRIDLLKNLQKTITQKSLNVSHNEVSKPASNLSLNIHSANIEVVQINIYRINATALEYFTFKQNNRRENEAFSKRSLLETCELKLKKDPNFGVSDTVYTIKSGDYGIYEVSINVKGETAKDKISNTVFVVSDFGFIQRSNVPNLQHLYVLDRQSGLPQAGVQVSAYEPKWTGNGYKYELKKQIKSDKEGLCKIPFTTNFYETQVFFERGKDKYFSSTSYANFYNRIPSNNDKVQLSLLTDRSLYRPGQTVYFKGIAYYAGKNRNEVDKSSAYEVVLYDANHQKISSKSFKTNEFGSFAGEFVLPEGGLNGAYRIESKGFSQTIYVEEYKRPTFEVTIEKPKTEVRFGEKVTLTGNVKAYARYNVPDAEVKYTVTRSSHRYCWWGFEPETAITNGSTVTDAAGKFDLTFIPEKSKNKSNSWRGNFYTYTVSADVTDAKGETQQGEQSLSVGDKSLFIIADVANKIDKNASTKIEIYAETLNGEKVDAVIDYEVYRLVESAEYAEEKDEKTELKTAEKVTSGQYKTLDKSLVLDMKKWKSAQYKLVLKTKDAFGAEVKTEQVFVLYDKDDKRPPVKSYVWMLTPKTTCAVGEKAEIRFGTSTKNTAVLYEIMQGNKVLESKWIRFNDEIKTFEIPFKDEYGAGVTALFSFMKDEQFFTQQVQIARKMEEKKLTPTLSVFRDKLQPGEKVEWMVTIPESVGNKKAAELLVGMYDASLDAIRPHSWNFTPTYQEGILYSAPWSANNFNQSNGYAHFDAETKDVYDYRFDNLNWFGLEFSQGYGGIRIRGSRSKNIQVEEDNVVFAMVESDGMKKEMVGSVAMEAITEDAQAESKSTDKVKVRTNFNETAFFYPQLKTDVQGNVKISFTAPESLTRWNVKMLAHTADLYFGQNDTTVITQKDLMVQMNLPRFVRRSDKLVLSANVINLTDKDLKANVTFELIDPATEKVIYAQTKTTPLSSRRGVGGEAVEFELSQFSSYELVICKIVARAGNFSDGEQKYLPVLPDKIMVTESMPLTIRGNETRTFNFQRLLKNASKVETKNLTVEFSTNPAWYAVQALPTLSTPENENALDYFSAYYANSLAAFIANSNPKIAKVFDQWKNAKGSREALLSNLQKNAELKNMLLEETPWVMAAKDETEQKKQIALLFDLNMQKNQAQQYLDKLLKLQTANGGFSWFEDMPESRYITQEILLNMARLNRMTKSNALPKSAIEKALYYLDMEISKDFANLKKFNKNYEKEMCIDNMQLFYLHVRSEYPEIPVQVSAQAALKYYTAQAEKYWTSFTLYGKAMMAVVANRNGKIRMANDILKSLKENALKTDEFGMYWAKNKPGYFWNERPVAVQAALIEAFAEVLKNPAELDEMKIWLLKQKQTQRWDSPIATVDAIYALLLQGNDWLSNEGLVQIKVGNTELKPQSAEVGTGYFKVTIPVADVRPAMGKITIHSFTPSEAMNSQITNSSQIVSATNSRAPNSGIGWGAMYWQYYQDMDKVSAQSGPLQISKKMFVERFTNGGKTMQPIEQTKLVKGDKVVTRLVITTDRNLEFVALKDLRASCFEPVDQRSGCEWKEGVCYYQTTKDASTQFFFSFLPKGTYVFEYELWVNAAGEYTNGIASVQCQYAPEFVSHSGAEKILINN
ncbi:MAG: alpha-2-macroglobulin family protein [Paludibacter sp.]